MRTEKQFVIRQKTHLCIRKRKISRFHIIINSRKSSRKTRRKNNDLQSSQTLLLLIKNDKYDCALCEKMSSMQKNKILSKKQAKFIQIFIDFESIFSKHIREFHYIFIYMQTK